MIIILTEKCLLSFLKKFRKIINLKFFKLIKKYNSYLIYNYTVYVKKYLKCLI